MRKTILFSNLSYFRKFQFLCLISSSSMIFAFSSDAQMPTQPPLQMIGKVEVTTAKLESKMAKDFVAIREKFESQLEKQLVATGHVRHMVVMPVEKEFYKQIAEDALSKTFRGKAFLNIQLRNERIYPSSLSSLIIEKKICKGGSKDCVENMRVEILGPVSSRKFIDSKIDPSKLKGSFKVVFDVSPTDENEFKSKVNVDIALNGTGHVHYLNQLKQANRISSIPEDQEILKGMLNWAKSVAQNLAY